MARVLVFCCEKHRSAVVHFLYRMVQNHAVAEELAQEVFLRVYRSRGTYEPTAKFTTWLFRIATHLALNALRDGKNERLQERLDDDSGDLPVRQVSDRRPSVEQTMVYRGQDGRSPARDCDAAGKTAGGGSDAQVRRDGVFADREGFELFGIGGEVAAVPGVRDFARAPGAYGVKVKAFMKCPMETRENAQLLLDYCTRKLEPESAAALERHIAVCGACRKFASGQRAVWQALDAWEAAPVSADFDSRLYRRIETRGFLVGSAASPVPPGRRSGAVCRPRR